MGIFLVNILAAFNPPNKFPLCFYCICKLPNNADGAFWFYVSLLFCGNNVDWTLLAENKDDFYVIGALFDENKDGFYCGCSYFLENNPVVVCCCGNDCENKDDDLF